MLRVMTRDECINECARVASILFHHEGWKRDEIGVPCYEDIRKALTELFRDLQKTDNSIVNISLGRLQVAKQKGGGAKVYLNIGFINE